MCSGVVATADWVGDGEVALLRTEGEVAAAGGVAREVVVAVVVTAGVEAPTVSSSVT